MVNEKSLDKIAAVLGINKKTAFDWRHKIWASMDWGDGEEFTGITESDESFFLRSEKGMEATMAGNQGNGAESPQGGA